MQRGRKTTCKASTLNEEALCLVLLIVLSGSSSRFSQKRLSITVKF